MSDELEKKVREWLVMKSPHYCYSPDHDHRRGEGCLGNEFIASLTAFIRGLMPQEPMISVRLVQEHLDSLTARDRQKALGGAQDWTILDRMIATGEALTVAINTATTTPPPDAGS